MAAESTGGRRAAAAEPLTPTAPLALSARSASSSSTVEEAAFDLDAGGVELREQLLGRDALLLRDLVYTFLAIQPTDSTVCASICHSAAKRTRDAAAALARRRHSGGRRVALHKRRRRGPGSVRAVDHSARGGPSSCGDASRTSSALARSARSRHSAAGARAPAMTTAPRRPARRAGLAPRARCSTGDCVHRRRVLARRLERSPLALQVG